MSDSVRVALCQIEVISGDREGNFARIEEAARSAIGQGAELAVFPESAILGWINPAAHAEAHPIPGQDSGWLCSICRSHGIGMVIGIDEKSGEELFGSAIAISAEGQILAVHRKANVLPELMEPPYSAGSKGAVTFAEFPFGKVAVLICADTFLEETIANVKAGKPDLLAVPYGWAAESDKWPSHGEDLRDLVCKIASQIGCPVVGVDAVREIASGPWRGRRFCGGSVAADRFGEPLTPSHFGECLTQIISVPVQS
jgi:predicted amidohydrolase